MSTVRIANSGITKTGGADPNSRRQVDERKCANGGKGLKNKADVKGQKGDSQPTVEAPNLTVQEFF